MKSIAIVCFVLLFTLPVFFATRSFDLRLDNDYDIGIPILSFVVDALRTGKALPSTIPYVGSGISLIGDPLSVVLNPMLLVPVMVLGVDAGMRVVMFLVFCGSALSMWILLTKQGVNGMVRLWGSLLYAIAGPVVAAMAAGHVVKFLSYVFIPLFFLPLLSPGKIFQTALAFSLVGTLVFFSGDFYILWFFLIFWIVTRGYYLWVRRMRLPGVIGEGMLAGVFWSVASSVKLIPFLVDVAPRITRFFPIDPFVGSIQVFWAPLPFLVPWGVSFYDRPFFQRLFGFHFNWHEYYAFVSPIPFLFLIYIRKLWKLHSVRVVVVLLAVGSLYASIGFPYSPFHWLYQAIPALQAFRVPQRMFTPMTALLILLSARCAHGWLVRARQTKRWLLLMLLGGSLLWTFLVNQRVLAGSFEAPRLTERRVAHLVRQRDGGTYHVALFACCMQRFLVEERIAIINYYHGWRAKDVPNFVRSDSQGFDYTPLTRVRPTYIIAKRSEDFAIYDYQPFFEEADIRVWKTDSPTIMPKQ